MNQMQNPNREKLFFVSNEFKSSAIEIFSTKKFSDVYPIVNILKSEESMFPESTLNAIVQVLGEYPYAEVYEFFDKMNTMITEATGPEENNEESDQAPAEA
jgi:hypothetical protein